MNCVDIIKTSYFIFSDEVPRLLYYSHLPALILSVFIGLWVYRSIKKSLEGKIFIVMSLIFSALSFCNLITWTNSNSQTISIFWFLTIELFNWLMFFLAYFFYVFVNHKDLRLFEKILGSIILLISPVLLLSNSGISHFDINSCELVISNNYYIFQLAVNILAILAIIFIFIDDLRISFKTKKVKDFLFFIATLVFAGFFIATWHLSSFFDVFVYEQIGYIGFVVFTAIIAYAIVRFKAFDIKLLGAQALVWALVILIGSQFLYMSKMPLSLLIITGATLIIASVVGMMIVRGVKREVSLRESLEIANRNQQSLIHFVSHQLKGFFTKSKMIFSGFLEGDFGETSPTGLEMAKTGLQSDNNAVAMIQDILGASNLKAGTTQYNFNNVDLNDLVKEICGLYTKEMENKGLKFDVQITEQPLTIFADRTQIIQVFKNLIDNAIKYSPAGTVKASLSLDPNGLKSLFEVKDTGIGLTESDKNRLFTEGGKGEESLKYNTDSAGYGLYIVKKIVETHKGKIWAESEGRGKGSKFCVELPIVQTKV